MELEPGEMFLADAARKYGIAIQKLYHALRYDHITAVIRDGRWVTTDDAIKNYQLSKKDGRRKKGIK